MCILAQTKFWEQANAGVYQAQVDNNLCKRSSDGGEGGDSSSSDNQAPDLDLVYVKSVREENKPLIAEMRVSAGEGKGESAYYHVKVVVVEPPSDEAPAGIFDMHYTAHMGSQTGQKGFIRTKRAEGGKFILESGGSGSEGEGRSSQNQGIAELEVVDENTVIGYVHSDSKGSEDNGQRTYSSAGQARFDANYLNVDYAVAMTSPEGNHSEAVKGCYDLNKYKTAIFRYDLVDASGTTVKRNSGFPVEFTKDGALQHGWAGYYGLWLGQNGGAKSGDTINKVTWTNGQKVSKPYTVFAAPGKLTKLTKATITLGELKGVDLNFWDSGNNYIVKWDGSTLSKTAKVSYGNNGPEEEAASGAVTIPQWGGSLWVPSLNANIQISRSMTLSDSLNLSYHSQKIVSGSSEVPSCNLVCFSNCPVMAPTATAFQRSSSMQAGPMSSDLYKKTTVVWDKAYEVNQAQNVSAALATYTWDATTQNLKEGSTAFALPTGLPTDQQSAQQLQNVMSGALVCSDVWSALADKTIDPWRLSNEIDTYYTFQSGAQDWNRYISLKDDTGAFVTFEAPLEISYTHTTANDWDGSTDTSFIGKSFRFQYSGPGQLQGIPWKYAKEIGHYMPLFSIKSGTKMGDYTAYAIDGEQRLAKAASDASCASIPLDSAPELPSIDDMTTIDVGALGDETAELRYVGGVSTK